MIIHACENCYLCLSTISMLIMPQSSLIMLFRKSHTIIKGLLPLLMVTFLFCALPVSVSGQIELHAETGVVTTGYNNVAISGSRGTRFSLKDDLDGKVTPFSRLRCEVALAHRHHIVLLYAPLTMKYQGTFDDDVLFRGIVFEAGKETEGVYKFNSYRLTYRYRLVQRDAFDFDIGLTAKIRDASIGLTSTGASAIKTDLGFVPIVHFRVHWRWHEQFGLLLEGDALASPYGRAEDVFLGAVYALSDDLTFRAGYRILEGGADNRTLYTFSLFHYASLGMSYNINAPDK